MATQNPTPPKRSLAAYEPVATVFLASAFIMVVELVAGRLVSRFLGMSLYTWTAIIGLILAGMSVGNYAGGILADRVPPRRMLGIVFLAGALGCATLLPLNTFVGGITALHGLSWPARIFAHVALVFTLPAILLGTVTPLVAKMALDRSAQAGTTVGNIFAFGAAGGILGTFLTGYWLVLWFGVREIVAAMAAALALIGVYYLATRKSDPAPGPALAPPAPETPGLRLREVFGANATVFISNASFMTIELVAMRIVSRHFGASLYAWTAVIGIVLAGITMGNALGGRIADRVATRKALAVLFTLCSILTLATPAITVQADDLFENIFALSALSWPAQTFLYTLICFFLPSLFLGTISPMVVKLILDRGRAAGRAVGGIYAWGAVGSITGTFLAGYDLIARVGSLPLIALVAFILAATALVYAPRTVWTPIWTGLCLLAFIGAKAPFPTAKFIGETLQLRTESNPWLVYEDESDYTYIAIWQDENNPNERRMYLDQLLHSRAHLDAPTELKYDYEWIYRAVLDKYWPGDQPVTALIMGGGGFTFPLYLELVRPGSHIEVAEIDPAVTESAFAAFGLPRDTNMHIYNMDARNLVTDHVEQRIPGREELKFDAVFGDSVNDYGVPYHLTTVEFAQDIHQMLDEDGIYMLNMIELLEPGRFLGAVVASIRAVFPHVYVFNTGRDPAERDTFVVVSAKRPLDLDTLPQEIAATEDYQGRRITSEEIDALIERNDSRVLTDNYAPVENLLTEVVATHREDVGELRLRRAQKFADEGNYAEAIRECKSALEQTPGWIDAEKLLCAYHVLNGDVTSALELAAQSFDNHPQPELAYHALAETLVQENHPEPARRLLAKAIAANAVHGASLALMGSETLKAGDPAAAIPFLDRAIQASPNYLLAHYNLGLAHAQNGDLDNAIASWRNALNLDPTHADSGHNLLVALLNLTRHDEAWQTVEFLRENNHTIDPALLQGLQAASGRTN